MRASAHGAFPNPFRHAGKRPRQRAGRPVARALRLAPTFAVSMLGLATLAGCGAPARTGPAASQPVNGDARAATDEWAPLPLPAGFDRARAALSLAQVPDDPPAPTQAPEVQSDELPRQALRRIEEARRLFAEQRFSETVQELERALRYNVNSAEAHRLMALAGLLSGNDERARTSAVAALQLKPDDLASHYVLAREAEKDSRPAEALREYRIALKATPAEGDTGYRLLVHYFLGNLLFGEGYYQAATEALGAFESGVQTLGDKVSENPELASIVRVHRGEAAIKVARARGYLGDYSAAADSLRVAMLQSPRDAALRTEYIRMLARAGRAEEAAAEIERMVSDTAGLKEAIDLLVTVHRRAGHPDRAVSVIKRLAEAQPDNVELWNAYVDALVAARQFDEAVAALNELTRRHPDATDGRWRLVQMTRERGQWPAWLTAVSEQLSANPSDSAKVRAEIARVPAETARAILGEATGSDGDREYTPAIPDDDRKAAALHCVFAWLAEQVDQPQQAEAQLILAVGRSPSFPPVVSTTVESHIEACRWNEALRAAAAAGDQVEPSAALERLIAQAHDGLDQVDPAVEHYQKAIDLDKSDIDSMLRLGRLLDRFDRTKEAERIFLAAIRAADTHMRAREELVRHYMRAGDNKLMQTATELQRSGGEDPAAQRVSAVLQHLVKDEPDVKGYVEALRKLVQAFPEDAQTREDLIDGLLLRRDFQAALAEAEELSRRRPCSAESADLLARARLGVLDFAGAVAGLKQAVEVYPNRESLLRRLAEAALIRQDVATEIDAQKRLLALKAMDSRRVMVSQGGLVRAYRRAGRFDEAREAVESWLVKAKGDDIERMRSYLLFIDAAAGDHDRYIARCREWLKTDADNDALRTLLIGQAADRSGLDLIDLVLDLDVHSRAWGLTFPASGLIGVGGHDEALILATRWLRDERREVGARNRVVGNSLRTTGRLLHVFESLGRHAEAIEVAQAAVSAARDDDDRSVARNLLLATYTRAGKSAEAIALARELAAAAGEESFSIDLQLISMLSRAARHDEAIGLGNRLFNDVDQQYRNITAALERETDPQRMAALRQGQTYVKNRQASLLRSLSYAYQRGGQREVAEQRLQEAYKLLPEDEGVNNDLGYLLADGGKDLAEAERMVRLAVAVEPLTAAYRDSMGWVFYKQGRFEQARAWLAGATQMDDGRDPVVFDHLADTEWRLGNKDRAMACWRESLKLNEKAGQDGMSEVEQDLPERVKAKLDAATAGQPPPVAAAGAEGTASRPTE